MAREKPRGSSGISSLWGWIICPLALSSSALGASLSGFTPRRPEPSRWQRTACGFNGTDLVTRWGAAVEAASTPLPEHPRPLMVRRGPWVNLNGLWEFEPVPGNATMERPLPVHGRPLSGQILVPFPPESCLSGAAGTFDPTTTSYFWYRLPFRREESQQEEEEEEEEVLLHFGAVDWQASVWVNGQLAGTHEGGYDGFSFDITGLLQPGRLEQELLLLAYDPSERGPQPQGKQRATAPSSPGSITYTPASGVWQTVWLEAVPAVAHISSVQVTNDPAAAGVVTVRVTATSDELPVEVVVWRPCGKGAMMVVEGRSGPEGVRVEVAEADRQLWAPGRPYLYQMTVRLRRADHGSAGVLDEVDSYFGLRSVGVGVDGGGVPRPLINGQFTYLAGWLDQSYWPDGVYTAPSDEALAYDLVAAKEMGLNTVRLHQKVNPQRWYYHADRLGVAVLQDVPQKLQQATEETVPLLVQDMTALMTGPVASHACVLQWTVFNEEDCWRAFNVSEMVALAVSLDGSRMVDADSGGGANGLHLAQVNDAHTYPFPGDPLPVNEGGAKQYGMVGEYGGLGLYPEAARQWAAGQCFAYKQVSTADAFTDELIAYIGALTTFKEQGHGSACIYTQATDTECECDGLLAYDRSHKLEPAHRRRIAEAHRYLIGQQAFEWDEEAGARAAPSRDLLRSGARLRQRG